MFAHARVGRLHAVVAVVVDAGRRDEAAEGGEEFEGREDEHRATVGRGGERSIPVNGDRLTASAILGLEAAAADNPRAHGLEVA